MSPAIWALLAFLGSLGLMGIYNLIARGVYDYDEFVYLLLGQGVAHGRLPYRDFLFYHPPGILVVMAALQPLIHHWWVWGRVVSVLLSAATCSLVYLTARRFWSHRVALLAALLFACDPILLVSGTKILPDVYVMFFTFLGIYLLTIGAKSNQGSSAGSETRPSEAVSAAWRLLASRVLPALPVGAGSSEAQPPGSEAHPLGAAIPTWRSLPSRAYAGLRNSIPVNQAEGATGSRHWIWAVAAGVAFGVAVWFKYPAGLAVPAALLLAGRRWLVFLVATAITALALFAPFLPAFGHLYQDTVVYQQSRFVYPLGIRILSVLLFGILFQPLAVFGLFGKPVRLWLVAGYITMVLYIASSQVYYHYLLPFIPFASILGAVYLARSVQWRSFVPVAGGAALAVTLLWAAIIAYTPGYYPFHITSAQTAGITPVSRYVDRHVPVNGQILDDQPNLPVLAYRPNCDNYFWSDATVITHSQLQFCLLRVRYIVHFYANGSGFPLGFLIPATDGSGIAPPALADKYCRKPAGSGSSGAFVYDTHCPASYIPLRD